MNGGGVVNGGVVNGGFEIFYERILRGNLSSESSGGSSESKSHIVLKVM